MAASDIRAGRAFVELGIKNNVQGGLKQVGSQLKSFGQTVGTIGAGMAAAGAAITAPLVAAVKHFADYGSQLSDMSKRTGIGAGALAELGYAAGQTGADIGAVETGIRKMQKTIADAGEGGKESVEALAALGLTFNDLKDLSPEKQFERMAAGIRGVKDPTTQAADTMRVLGKSGTALLPMIMQMDTLRDRAKALGVTMDDETVKASKELGQAFNDAEAAASGLQLTVGGALAPAVKEATEWVVKTIVAANQWVRENKEAVIVVAKLGVGLTVVGTVLAVVGAACYAAGAAIGVLTGAVGALNVAIAFLAANPMALAIAAIAAAAAVAGIAIHELSKYTAELSDKQATLLNLGDKQRQSDQDSLERLAKLGDGHRLNNAEMEEAERIIAALQGHYGELGLSVDKTSGAILGMGEAQQKLNAAMRSSAILETKAQIAELENNISELRKKLEHDSSSFWANTIFGSGGPEAVKQSAAKISVEMAKLRAAQERFAALDAGDTKALTTPKTGESGQAPRAVGDDDIAAIDEKRAKAKDKAAQAEKELAAIEEQEAAKRRTRQEQEIHDIEETTKKKQELLETLIAVEGAKGDAADPDRIGALQYQHRKATYDRDDAIGDVRQKHADEDNRQAQDAQSRRDKLNADQQFENNKLEIEVDPNLDETQKKLATLALEYERELKEATARGLDPSLIDEKFRLLDKQLKGNDPAVQKNGSGGPHRAVVGTFSATALLALGRGGSTSPAEQQVALAKAAAKDRKAIALELKKKEAIPMSDLSELFEKLAETSRARIIELQALIEVLRDVDRYDLRAPSYFPVIGRALIQRADAERELECCQLGILRPEQRKYRCDLDAMIARTVREKAGLPADEPTDCDRAEPLPAA